MARRAVQMNAHAQLMREYNSKFVFRMADGAHHSKCRQYGVHR